MSLTTPVSNSDRVRHAISLIEMGNHKQANRLLKSVLKDDPRHAEGLLALGVLCGMRGDDLGAVKYLTQASRRKPDLHAAHYNLGQALIRLGRHREATPALETAVKLSPQSPFHEKLADCFRQTGELDNAARHYARAVDLAGPGADGMLLSSLVETKRRICDWGGLAALETRLLERIAAAKPVEPLLLNYVTDDPAILKRNAAAYATGFLPAMLQPGRDRFTHASRERQRIRVGYLCSDFRNHATAHLMAELFEHHDRSRFETIAISFGPDDKGVMRNRLEKAFDRFIDMAGRSSAEIAKRIHALGIDILVDLNGYIANARPDILMPRPAPVQCHYLAFPGTLGAPWIDYHIVDPVIAPPGEEIHFTEQLVRLPGCYQPNDAKREIAAEPPSRAACGLPEGAIVLASFNNAIKISPGWFGMWMRILSAVPDSVLWLYADNAFAPDNLRAAAQEAGIAPERLVFAGYSKSADHLARLANADVLLDSFPYGAHTTASDALWVGVPVVTMAGRSFASRVCASLMTSAGLPDLVTASAADYERTVIALAQNPSRITALRSRLASAKATCPLFDTASLARQLESAYTEMWRRWRAGEPASAYDVPRLAGSSGPA